jgi:hypothetical protein
MLRINSFVKTSLAIVVAFLAAAAGAVSIAQAPAKAFVIYDNMFYKGKPDTARIGLIPSNVLYENKIWPTHQEIGTLPDHTVFVALVHATNTNPGPFVIDIENVSLRVPPEGARHNAELLAKLADWAHEAAPGKVVGFYGTNTLSDVPQPNFAAAQELARHVDAFFPALYTFDDDRARWEKRAQTSLAEARELDPKKPIYFYIWPQYHVGSARALRYVNGEYWKFQLETARHYGDGVVIWGSSSYVWDPRTGWWDATQQFASSLQSAGNSAGAL